MPLFLGIPAHIRGKDLGVRCIDSAMAGTRPPDAVVVVDNYGGFSHPDPRVTVIRPSENLGVAKSWNLIHRRVAPCPLILSNDDVTFSPWAIEAAENTPAPFVGLCGWSCFLQREEVWQKVGDYDEAFWPAYFEDNDYHYRMKLAGLGYANLDGGAVAHEGSATLRSETEVNRQTIARCFSKNQSYYVRKWGGPPGGETFTKAFGP